MFTARAVPMLLSGANGERVPINCGELAWTEGDGGDGERESSDER